MNLHPNFKQMVNEAVDPLYMSAKLAFWGNSIDLMVTNPNASFENSIEVVFEAPLSHDIFSAFDQQLKASNRLVYFSDNAGKIVLDKLLIETIKELHSAEIVFVARSVPYLNDATLLEASSIDLHNIARVIENGVDGHLPGTLLNLCSNEVKDAVNRSDLINAKGSGNLDTLDEERNHLTKTFLFGCSQNVNPILDISEFRFISPSLPGYYRK